MAAQPTVTAAVQTAIDNWTRRHRTTLGVSFGGPVLLAIALSWFTNISLTLTAVLLLMLLTHLGQKIVGIWWWLNQRRRVLAKASLPAPDLRGLLAQRRLEARRIKRIQTQWVAFCEANNYRGVGKVVPHLRKFGSTVEGDITCMVSPGTIAVKGGVERLAGLRDDLREVVGRGCADVSVRHVGTDSARIRFFWSNPLERELPIAEMPPGPADQIVFGKWSDGAPASVPMAMHLLLGAMSGFGKSSTWWAMNADLNRKGIKFDLAVIDPKGGAECQDYEPHLGQRNGGMLVSNYCQNAESSVVVLDDFIEHMKARYEWMRSKGIRKWEPRMADEAPLSILFIDECLEVFDHWKEAKDRGATTKGGPMQRFENVLLSQGRAAGFMVVALTQTGEVKDLGSARRKIPMRMALATDNAMGTNMILGDGADTGGAPCSKITIKGLGYSQREGIRGFDAFRAAMSYDDDRARIAQGLLPDGMDSTIGKAPANRQCAIYYFFTADGQSVYVGISVDPGRRRDEHAGLSGKPQKWWWQYVDESKTVIIWADSEAAARVVEEREIKRFAPIGNKQHNSSNPKAGAEPASLPVPVPAKSRRSGAQDPAPSRRDNVTALSDRRRRTPPTRRRSA